MVSPALRFGGTLLLAMVLPAWGQFSQLAATDDGKQIYFTSQLLLKGATPAAAFPETRIYRFGADGVTLFAERGTLASKNSFSSGDGASNPQISGDGTVVGYTLNDVCLPGSECVQSEGQVRGASLQDLGPGSLQMSRNGRWALLTTTQSTVRIDLSTGQRTVVPAPGRNYYGPSAAHNIASDGTVLGQQDGVMGLWKQGQFTPVQLPLGLSLNALALSDDATALFLAGGVPGPVGLTGFRILAMNIASGKLTTLFQQKDTTQIPVFMGASNNGQFVLYRYGVNQSLNGPAFVFNTATGAATPISLPDGEFAADGTLTGGGDIAFLATTGGRLVKAAAGTGAVAGLFPATPHCGNPQVAVPGSLVRLQCNFGGSVLDLQGQILVNDVAMPILYTAADEIGAQVPWDIDSFFPGTLRFATGDNSPFQASQPLNLTSMSPLFERADPGTSPLLGLKLVKGDWSGLLTSQPAPGDLFYAYMTGLGAVDGPMQTGAAAPNAVAPITGSLTCQFAPNSSPAKTVFAGLAPGTVGLYQVAFQVPADAGPQPITCLSCSWRGSGFGGGFFSGLCPAN